MYEIRPESIKTFIENTSIKLPRFQRKQTWDEIKNFKLCISVFKEYPIGVSILSVESDNNATRWLLDGRQRRNALIKMSEDPENIYLWARKFIGFKENMQPHEVEEKFWQKIGEYLELDSEKPGDDKDSTELSLDAENVLNSLEEDDLENGEINKTGFDLLLQIILLVHNKTKKYSGFSKPFDFTAYVEKLPYVDNSGGKEVLNSKKIKSFIKEYKNYCKDDGIDYEFKTSFLKFLLSRFRPSAENEKKMDVALQRDWEKIMSRITLIDKIDNLLLHAKIGLIEVKNISISDGQKIFNIINTEGTELTAIEVLSAKPNWNKEIKNPSSDLISASRRLYDVIGIKNENVVRWDAPATLLDRLNGANTIFKNFNDLKTPEFEKKLTLGFKLLSGLLGTGVKKEDINSLTTNANVKWETSIDDLINNLNLYLKLLNESDYFKYFISWKGSIMHLLSDATALNFILITFKDWERKGKPIGSSTVVKQFQKNCFILFDRLIYEYINRLWRGSSDALIAQNIKDFSNSPELFHPIDGGKWSVLLTDIFDKNLIGDINITQQYLTPLLYHSYCMSKIAGPDSNILTIEVDHIIPTSLFDQAADLRDKDILQNNLFNLALLPKRDNISKSNLKLIQIDDDWLKEQIKKYALIEEHEYPKFSSINSLNDLKKKRRSFFEDAFTTKRSSILN